MLSSTANSLHMLKRYRKIHLELICDVRALIFSPGMPERASALGGLSSLQHGSGGRNGTGFHGCLRNLYINGKLQDLAAGLRSGTAGSATAQSTSRQWLGQGMEPGCQPCQRASCLQGDCHPTGHRGFSCTCHPGWTGTLCDQQVNNPCDGNKWVHLSHYYYLNKCFVFVCFLNFRFTCLSIFRCVHGTCLPINSYSYSCRCQPGHSGVLCDEQDQDATNPCSLSQCKHGKCRVSGLGKAYCECNSGYTGETCERGEEKQTCTFFLPLLGYLKICPKHISWKQDLSSSALLSLKC